MAAATAVGLLAAGCSWPGSGGARSDAEPAATSTEIAAAVDGAADGGAPDLEGIVDRVVVMIPPGGTAKPPDSGMFDGGVVLAGRHVLRAPGDSGKMVDLWVLRVRSPQMGPGIQECRVLWYTDGSGGGSSCSALADGPPPAGPQQGLVLGASSDESSFTLDLVGPADMTHFIVTAGDQRIGVIPIEGQALLTLDGACPADTRVAAWRNDEQLREEPTSFC